MNPLKKLTSIRENLACVEMQAWFETSSQQTFNSHTAHLESDDPAAFAQMEAAYYAAFHALDAVLDAHCAQQAYLAGQEVRQSSVPVAALSGLLDHAENEREDGLYQAMHRFRDAWNALPPDNGQRTPEQAQTLDEACADAERGVIAAVQGFAARRCKALLARPLVPSKADAEDSAEAAG